MLFFIGEVEEQPTFQEEERGKDLQHHFDTQKFWPNVDLCLKIASPLIKVLKMVDSDDKPAMGFLYKSIERAKEEIKANLRNTKKRYEPVFDIIVKRWEEMLCQPLHAAGYYLNPQFHYSPEYQSDVNVKRGLYECMSRMIADKNEQEKIDLQLDIFKHAKGLFGIENAIRTRNKKLPADWWDSFGDECRELQRFAIRILSLTCSSSGCERNWSAFKLVHSKRINRLAQKRMNDLVFVMYNLKLRERENKRQKQRMQEIEDNSLEDVPSDDEWITEKEDPVLPRDNSWLRILDENPEVDTSDEEEIDEVDFIASNLMNTSGEGSSGSRVRRKRRFRSIDEIEDIVREDEDDDVSNQNVDEDFDDDLGDDVDHD